MSEITPFRAEITGAQIDDLRSRLERTRWPEKETVDDWSQGIPMAYVRDIADYWASEYDMQRVAAQLNRYEQFTTEIDGVDIHFLHVKSPVADATPCVMTHGWPGSVIEFMKVIEPLTDPAGHGGSPADALHLVVPSLPGYGFSGKPTEAGWDVHRIARAWAELMPRLGYERYLVQGGDWGGLISWSMGSQSDNEQILGVHVNTLLADPAKLAELGEPTAYEQQCLNEMVHYQQAESGYAMEQGTKPQTIGYSLVDSPAGQAAWIIEKFMGWSDCGDHPENSFTRDELLDNVMVYWLNAAGASSARLYWHSIASAFVDFFEITKPCAYSVFPKEIVKVSERWAQTRCSDLRYYNEAERGGHFAAFEAPDLFVQEVRSGFRALA